MRLIDNNSLSAKSLSTKSTSKWAHWILIVDDESDIVSIFKQALNKKGFHVFGFTDPLLALEHFQINSKQYSLVISDLRMPAMNGYEFIRKVKEIKPEVKVFLMTAFEINDAEFRSVFSDIEIEGLIQKPVSLANLASTISKYVPSRYELNKLVSM
jgi:DNA-binding NtrC family response regulator